MLGKTMWYNIFWGSFFGLYVLTFILFVIRGKGEYSFIPWAFASAVMAGSLTACIYFLDQALHFL